MTIRLLVLPATAAGLAIFLSVSNAQAQAENPACGTAPSLPTVLQNDESLKGQLQGQADFLSKFVGKAELNGEVEAARKQLYQSSKEFFAAQKDAYLAYLFCMLIMPDKSLSTEQKLKALNVFREPPPDKSGARELATELSELSRPQLRDRASRFTAQLREFEAQHMVEQRRSEEKEFELSRQLLPVITDKDRQHAQEIWEHNQSAMTERSAAYQAAFSTRFRAKALAFREELCTREGVHPPYKIDLRATAPLETGILPGINPVGQLADYLDELIRKLPD